MIKQLPTATFSSSSKHADGSPKWGFQEPASSPIASHHQTLQQQTQLQTKTTTGKLGRAGPSPSPCQPKQLVLVYRRLPIAFRSLSNC